MVKGGVRWTLLLFLSACNSSGSPMAVDAAAGDGSTDAAPDATGDKVSGCASSFGNVLTNDHGRIDGTVIQVQMAVFARL